MSPEIDKTVLAKLENYLESMKSFTDTDDLISTKDEALKLTAAARSLVIYGKGKYDELDELAVNGTVYDLDRLNKLYQMGDEDLWINLSQGFYIIGAIAPQQSGTGDLLLRLLQEYNEERDQLN
jgi:hypothetical protein